MRLHLHEVLFLCIQTPDEGIIQIEQKIAIESAQIVVIFRVNNKQVQMHVFYAKPLIDIPAMNCL